MARKTFSVSALRDTVNETLLHTTDSYRAQRQGQIVLLETVLHEAGQYRGFGYLNRHDMEQSKNGHSVGIKDQKCDNGNWDFTDTDDTRVHYF